MAAHKLRLIFGIRTTNACHGGPAKSVMELASALHRRGHSVTLITADTSGLPAVWNSPEYPGVVKVAAWPGPRGLLSNSALRLVRESLTAADVLHLNEVWEFMNVQMASMATQLGVPYIMSPRGSLSEWPLSHKRLRKRIFALTVGRALLKQASAFHFTALDEQNQSKAYVHGAQKFIAPNLIDLTNYSPAFDADLIQRSCEIDSEDIVLLFMGRLVPNKGVHLIIRALPRVRAAFPKIRLVIAGSGDAGDAKKLADEMGISSIVRFVGFADGQLKRSLLARASLLLLPSRTENFANVLFEAAASGTRSLISRHVNTWQELVAAGASQIIDLSPDSIAEGILNELQRSPEDTRSRDRHALEWARNFYSDNRVVELYERAYLSLRSERRSSCTISPPGERW